METHEAGNEDWQFYLRVCHLVGKCILLKRFVFFKKTIIFRRKEFNLMNKSDCFLKFDQHF